jgi:hypothetical protein
MIRARSRDRARRSRIRNMGGAAPFSLGCPEERIQVGTGLHSPNARCERSRVHGCGFGRAFGLARLRFESVFWGFFFFVFFFFFLFFFFCFFFFPHQSKKPDQKKKAITHDNPLNFCFYWRYFGLDRHFFCNDLCRLVIVFSDNWCIVLDLITLTGSGLCARNSQFSLYFFRKNDLQVYGIFLRRC